MRGPNMEGSTAIVSDSAGWLHKVQFSRILASIQKAIHYRNNVLTCHGMTNTSPEEGKKTIHKTFVQ